MGLNELLGLKQLAKLRTSSRVNLQASLMLWFVFVVAIPVAALSLGGIKAYEDDVVRQAQDKVTSDLNMATQVFHAKGNKVEIKDGKMVIDGTYTVNDNYEIVDTIKSMVGGTATVFQGDTRVSTNVLKDDGQRAVGTKAAANVTQTVLTQGKRYTGRAWVVNAWYLTAYDPIVDPSGKVIGMLYVGTPEKPYVDMMDNFKLRAILSAVGAIILALIVSYFISRSIARPVKQVTKAAQGIARGEVNQELDVNRQDELGAMNRAFLELIDYFGEIAKAAERIAQGDLRHQIKPKSENDVIGMAFVRLVESIKILSDQVKVNASGLSDSSSELLEVAEHVQNAANQVLEAMEQISHGSQAQAKSAADTSSFVERLSLVIGDVAKGAHEQDEAVQIVSSSVGQISNAIESAVASTQRLALASETAGSRARNGAEVADKTVDGMQSIRSTVKESAAKITALGERSRQIGGIVEKIDDIAEQTNLLALNAAIEAARAGEHGMGFAVVANEVRKLAEGASSATKEIGQLIEGVQVGIKEAVIVMEKASQEVDNGAGLVDQARSALNEIMDAVATANKHVSEISATSEQMLGESRKVAELIENVSAIVQENSAATDEMAGQAGKATEAVESIAAVSEENSAAVEEMMATCHSLRDQAGRMTGSAQDLSRMAGDLDDLVSRFEADEEMTVARRATDRRRVA